jgi:lysophospholipase L1-like esterase
VAICLAPVLLEATARAYFAVKVGRDVLLYGIVESPHDVLFDPKGEVLRWDERNANTAIHDNVFANYSKYYPHQNRIHPDESGTRIDATINSSGFRGKDFERKKKPGVTRIVTLGASSTFGFKTRDDQTYPYYLEEILNKANSDREISKYEVINLGIPHLRSDQIYSLFMAEAVPLEPDIVTFYEGYIDASSSPRDKVVVASVKKVPFVTGTFRELRHRLLSVAWVANKLFGRRYPPNDATVKDFQVEMQDRKARFVENLEAIYQECQRRHFLFIVMNQQAKSFHVDRDRIKGVTYSTETALLREKLSTTGVLELEKHFLIHGDLMEGERQWVKANDVPFVDVIGAMDSNRQYLIDWMHLNAQGNRIVATALSDKIAGIRR